ncbi:MAG: NACHT domain-containing protein, partial [Cyanobacteria bacterium J06626_18]
MVSRLWNFLGLDTRAIAALDAMNSGVRDAKAVVGLAEVLAVEGPDLQKLAPFIVNVNSLLDALNSPLAEIAEAVLSFIPIGSALLQLYAQNTQQKPTLAQKIILISQAAYLEAIKTLLAEPQLEKWLAQVGDRPASNAVRQKIQRLAAIDLRESDARRTLRSFQNSALAAAYGEVLIARLSELGIEPRQAGKVALQLTQQTHKVLLLSLQNSNSDRPQRSAKQPRSAAVKRSQSQSSEPPPQRSVTQPPSPVAPQPVPLGSNPSAPNHPPQPPAARADETRLPQAPTAKASDSGLPLTNPAGQRMPKTTRQAQPGTGQSSLNQQQETILPNVIESFLLGDSASVSSGAGVMETPIPIDDELPLSEVHSSSRVSAIAPNHTQANQPSSLEAIESSPPEMSQPSTANSTQSTQPARSVESSLGDSVEQLFPSISAPASPQASAAALPEYDELALSEVAESALPEVDESQIFETIEPDLAEAIDPLLPEIDESLLHETAESILPEISEPLLPETVEPIIPEAIASTVSETIDFSAESSSSAAAKPPLPDASDQSLPAMATSILPEEPEFAAPELAESQVSEASESAPEIAEADTSEVPDLSSLTINELVALEAQGGIQLPSSSPVTDGHEQPVAKTPLDTDREPSFPIISEPSPGEVREFSLPEVADALLTASLATESSEFSGPNGVEQPLSEVPEPSPRDVSESLLLETDEQPEHTEAASEPPLSLQSETVESFFIQADGLPLSEVIEPPPAEAIALPDLALPVPVERVESSAAVAGVSSDVEHFPSEVDIPAENAEPSSRQAKDAVMRLDEGTDTAVTDAPAVAEAVTRETNPAPTAEKDPEWFQLEVDTAVKKQLSIDTYLTEWIAPRPNELVFEEPFSLNDIYVPLKADLLTPVGNTGIAPVSVELAQWVRESLKDESQSQAVVVLQAEPGRGKSLFCSLFADWVRCHEHPGWTPILIHLRDVAALSETFEATLAGAIDREFATANVDWLSDRTARFLFLLDGVDELCVSSEELAQFLQQVGQFQKQCAQDPQMSHRVVLTTRPLALQAIAHSLPNNLTWLEILALDDDQRQQWCDRWASLVGAQTPSLMEVLQSPSLPEWIQELAYEPLLLYRLAALHREGELQLEKFAGAERATAEILICDRILNWLVIHRRPEQSGQQGTQLSPEDLHHILQEVGLCIAQSAAGSTTLQVVRDRLSQDSSTVSLATASFAQLELDDFALWNVLTAFYLRPGEEHAQSLEFEYEHWGEFFYIKRLVSGLTALCQQVNHSNCISDDDLCWLMYDLFSYPGLTPERMAYLMTLLVRSPDFEAEHLHQRLYRFYWRWCQGEFIDAPAETLPQKALRLLKERAPEQSRAWGQRQIDAQVGLNTLILLLEL